MLQHLKKLQHFKRLHFKNLQHHLKQVTIFVKYHNILKSNILVTKLLIELASFYFTNVPPTSESWARPKKHFVFCLLIGCL